MEKRKRKKPKSEEPSGDGLVEGGEDSIRSSTGDRRPLTLAPTDAITTPPHDSRDFNPKSINGRSKERPPTLEPETPPPPARRRFFHGRDGCTVICNYLKLIVMLDFFGVALVVPLLPSYLSRMGCCNEQLAFISSAYSLAQLIGGILLGWISDGMVSRKTILMSSLIGSALSYGMVGVSCSKSLLILSRIVVGLVKQTMTMTTAMISDLPMDRTRRTKHLSHVTAAVTISWILGPAIGGYLFSISPLVPPLVAACTFTLAALICAAALPDHTPPSTPYPDQSPRTPRHEKRPKNVKEVLRTFKTNLNEILDDPTTIRIVSIRLLYSFLIMSLMPTHFVGYLEARYGLKSHEVAYLHSYRATLSFLAQTFLITAVVRHHAFSEEATARLAIVAGVLIKGAEVINRDRLVFLFVTTPFVVAIFSLFDSSMQGIYTESIPPGRWVGYKGAALGSMSALQSLVKVLAPLYGGEIFQRVGHERRPEVIFWHYVLLAVVVWVIFPPGRIRIKRNMPREEMKEEVPVSGIGTIGAAAADFLSGEGERRNGTGVVRQKGEMVVLGPAQQQQLRRADSAVLKRMRDRWERGSRVKVA